ncbi:hypothetical protein VTJ04DRAFT_3875 [Mycothermus thermophilus]|uniref:uncharacterized protein n=1 Tax=Humicola insolens TaxID=85995 RepID=UPI003744AB39
MMLPVAQTLISQRYLLHVKRRWLLMAAGGLWKGQQPLELGRARCRGGARFFTQAPPIPRPWALGVVRRIAQAGIHKFARDLNRTQWSVARKTSSSRRQN